MKRIWCLVILLCVSCFSSISAHSISKNEDNVLNNKAEKSKAKSINIEAEALYLKPVMDENDTFISSEGTKGNTHYFEKTLDWSLGFKLEADYSYVENKSLFIHWYHYKKFNQQQFFDNYTFIQKNQELEGTYLRLATPTWDAINLGVEQAFVPTLGTEIRFAGGFQLAGIKTGTTIINLTSSNSQIVAPGDYETHALFLKGFGPRFGVLFSVFPIDKLNIYTQTGLTLLVGNSTYSGYEGLDVVFAVPQSGNYLTGKKTWTTFPSLDERLGVSYTYGLGSNHLKFDIGYFCVDYFKAQQLGKLQTDTSFIGPYAGISLQGDVF